MANKVALEKYYNHFFKGNNFDNEVFEAILRGHIISSEYYDVQFGDISLVYRDKFCNLTFVIARNDKVISIYFDFYMVNTVSIIDEQLIKSRISKVITFCGLTANFLEAADIEAEKKDFFGNQ
jgi:hypothetical protein